MKGLEQPVVSHTFFSPEVISISLPQTHAHLHGLMFMLQHQRTSDSVLRGLLLTTELKAPFPFSEIL